MGKTKVKAKNDDNKVGMGKLLRWQSSGISVTVATLLIQSYISYFCTDALYLEPAIVAIVLAASKVFDSVTDVLAGFIIDRTNTRWGKGRPYEIFMVLLWLATWLLFACPAGLSNVMKYVWVFIMYIFVNAVCCTFLNGNNVVYMVRAFKTREQQTKIVAYGNFFSMAAGFVFNIAFPIAMTKIATDASGWARLVAMMAVPLTLLGLIRVLTIKEEYNNEDDTREDREKLKVKDCFTLFASNRDALLLTAILLFVNMATGLGVGTYYFKYVIGNTALISVASVATILGLPIAFLLPVMRNKLGMRQMSLLGFYVQMAGLVVYGLAGSNLLLVLVAVVLTSIGTVPFTMMLNMFIVDCADYNEMINKPRMEGTMGSVFGLAKKVGAALGTLISGLLLSAVNYSSTLPMGIENNAAVIMIRLLSSLIPFLILLCVVLLLRRYHLDEKLAPWREAQKAASAQAAEETATEA